MSSSSSKIRYDWYQTDEKVVITVLIKNGKEYNVKIEPFMVDLKVDDYSLSIPLCKEINSTASNYKVTPYKVEITLAKKTAERWNVLEQPPAEQEQPKELPNKVVNVFKKDWDSVDKEIAKDMENNEDGDPLQNLFQKIYSTSSEEVRRAMNKSYSESGGTVLSTNWQEIGKQKTDVKPPDGTEFRKWDGPN